MMNRLFLGIAIAGVSTAAFAADFPVKAPPPPAVAPPSYNWNGCYIGGNAGGKWWANTSGTLNILPGTFVATGPGGIVEQIPPGPTTSFDFGNNSNNASFIGGGQVGCNYQAGQFVFGIEGDGDWQHLSRTGTLVQTSVVPDLTTNGSFNLTSNWQASLRGRFGYAADRVLWYATGGVAWTNVSFSGSETYTFFGEDIAHLNIVSVSQTTVGGTAGVGVEYAIADQLTVGLEGRYTWYGSRHLNTSAVDAAPVLVNFNLNTAEVIGKLNWKFGGNEQQFSGNEQQRERR
jgi:outer membrane immunogenic protein